MNTRTVPIVRVNVGQRRRAVDRQKVKGLADSIGEVGLLNPISVQAEGEQFTEYMLVAGRHRLEAAKLLGWSEIPACLVVLDDVDRLLAEIDENLIRNELSDLERSEHLAERKRLYLLKHPETKHGGAPGKAGGGKTKGADSASFATDTAAKTGSSERSVQVDVQIGESIPQDVRDAIRDTPLADSKTDLLNMARLPEEQQREIVQTTDLTDKAAVREAISERRPATRRTAEESQAVPDDDASLGFGDAPTGDDPPIDADPEAVEPEPVPDVSEWATVERPAREIARPTADSPRASRIPPYVHPQPCTECGGDVLVESVQHERAIESKEAERHPDGTRVTLLCERCQLGDDDPAEPVHLGDAPATADNAVTDHPESKPARAGQEPVRGSLGGSANGAAGLGKRSAISTPAPSPRKGPDGAPLLAIQNDAGDLSRALLDKPIAEVAGALGENATPNQIAALVGILSARLGPEQRAALERRQGTSAESPAFVTLATIKAQIREHLTRDDIRDLEWWLPDARKEIGARERSAVAAAS